MRSLLCLLALLALPAAAEPDSVTMTLDDFLKLYDASKEVEPPEPTPPRDFALSSARYEGRVVRSDGDPTSAVFTAQLRVDVLKDEGWVRVPVLPSSVALRSAKVGGKEADVVPDGAWLVLVTDRRGAFDVVLEFAVSVATREGSSAFEFPLAPAGATLARLAVPSDELLDFAVANARLTETLEAGDSKVVEAVVPSTGSLAVSWQRALPELPAEAGEAARVHAEVQTLVQLGDGLLSERAAVAWTVLRGEVDRFTLAIPEDTTVVDVSGAAIRDWRVENGVLGIDLNYAERSRWNAVLQLERLVDPEGEALTVPLPEPLGVDRARGYVGVVATGTLEVTAGATDDAALIDGRLLPPAIIGVTSSPILLGFKYLGGTAQLPLQITRHEDVAVLVTLLDQAQATTMVTDDGRRLSSVRYRVRNHRKQFLKLALPAEAELWSASVAGKGVTPARAADGRLMLPLVRSQHAAGALADFEVEVVCVESSSLADGFRAQLPAADVPITHVAWTVYVPRGSKVPRRSKDGSLRAVDHPSSPFASAELSNLNAGPAADAFVQRQAAGQIAHGGLGEGTQPVRVQVPLEGEPLHFEKLLALDEELWVGFDVRLPRR